MNDAQKKAWDCLNEIERQSLFLQLSESKSSWEAGEILKLSLQVFRNQRKVRKVLQIIL